MPPVLFCIAKSEIYPPSSNSQFKMVEAGSIYLSSQDHCESLTSFIVWYNREEQVSKYRAQDNTSTTRVISEDYPI